MAALNVFRTAVVGVGNQGKRHAEKFARLPQSRLTAVVDLDRRRRTEVAASLGVEALADYRDLIGRVDAVAIAVPTRDHFEIVSTFLENDVHVLVEKPICSDMDQAGALVRLAATRSRVLQVGHLERFNPAFEALHGNVVAPRFIESRRIAPFKDWATDVDVVLDLMIHDIDLIHRLVGSRVRRVDANGGFVITTGIDIANARIRFECGCVANVTASRVGFKTERSLRVFEENAYCSVDMHNRKLTICRKPRGRVVQDMSEIEVVEKHFVAADSLLVQGRAFLKAVAAGAPPLVPASEGQRALETAITIRDMIRNGTERLSS